LKYKDVTTNSNLPDWNSHRATVSRAHEGFNPFKAMSNAKSNHEIGHIRQHGLRVQSLS